MYKMYVVVLVAKVRRKVGVGDGSLSEHEIHWRAFLKCLKDRSMNGVKLIISDDHKDLGQPEERS